MPIFVFNYYSLQIKLVPFLESQPATIPWEKCNKVGVKTLCKKGKWNRDRERKFEIDSKIGIWHNLGIRAVSKKGGFSLKSWFSLFVSGRQRVYFGERTDVAHPPCSEMFSSVLVNQHFQITSDEGPLDTLLYFTLFIFIYSFFCLFSYRFTSVPYRITSLSTVTLVSDEAIAPIRMEIITRPVNVHIIPKMRPMIDLGARSPYLSTNISRYGTSH